MLGRRQAGLIGAAGHTHSLLSVFGHRVLRTEDPRMLRGGARYVDDVPVPGALHAVFVRSPLAHARVLSIDTSGVPEGVHVFTGADVDLEPGVAPFGNVRKDMPRPRLAGEFVRFVGDAVAVVLAETRAEAVD